MKDIISNEILIYTDGSCHTGQRIGAWVAILLYEGKKTILRGHEINTTHNRMELMAVIKAIGHVSNNVKESIVIQIITDSQYVAGLPARAVKLTADNFITKKGTLLPNADLVKAMFHLFANNVIQLNKIKAHQKKDETINYNIEADKLSRGMIRALIRENE